MIIPHTNLFFVFFTPEKSRAACGFFLHSPSRFRVRVKMRHKLTKGIYLTKGHTPKIHTYKMSSTGNQTLEHNI